MFSHPTIDDIPYEILNEVLKLSIPNEKRGLSYTFERSRTALRLVSRRWNGVIIQNPRLWNYVSIKIQPFPKDGYIDNETHQRHVLRLDQIRAAAQRSGKIPRELHLNLATASAYTDEFERKILRGTVDFVHSISNWISVEVFTSDSRVVQQIFPVGGATSYSKAWPALRRVLIDYRLEIDQGEGDTRGSNPPPVFLFMSTERFPSLRSVTLALDLWTLPMCQLPWGQLTKLNLSAIQGPFSEYVHILAQCGFLESLCILVETLGHNFAASDASSISIVTLPKLKTLNLTLKDTSDIIHSFLAKIKLPSLTALSVKECPRVIHPQDRLMLGIAHLVKQSNCNILHLDIKLMLDVSVEELDEHCLAYLVKASPSLKTLKFGAAHVKGMFFAKIYDQPLSNLRSITIFSNYDDEKIKNLAAEAFVNWVKHWVQGNKGSRLEDGDKGKIPPFKATYHAERDGYVPKNFPPSLEDEKAKLQGEGWDVTLKKTRRYSNPFYKFRQVRYA
ncbi:hypothetical protein D9611_014051 [Ephemerocybe angulata]|uniref:F-box domain-containing protein n=1 Tax=Ephemerocybe angulata TaxID=980116 RepID=A0A8H5ERP4_9AGAR|nr:hypothetical protein D9611_014051 [Tulosesus angulatus]